MWAGQIDMRVGGLLVGVEYDTAETAEAVRRRCRSWLIDDEPGPRPAFGVRTAAVGFLRRRIGLVHHGAPVRYRAPDLAAAVDALGVILDGVARPRNDGELALPLRVYSNGERALLVDVAPSVIVDERPVRRRGIRELPCWRAIVAVEAGAVVTADGLLPVAAIVVANPAAGSSVDAAKRHVWAMADGDRERWARWLDESPDRVVLATDVARALAARLA